MSNLVSILIPCYNAEKWIAETIQSALDQTWQNKEIIVVDDGSSDGSLSIAQKFSSSKVAVISQKNRGASSARNLALRKAQGDFIQYLDADDLLAADKIERQVKLLGECGKDFICAGEWGRFYNYKHEADFLKQTVWQDMSSVDWLVCSWEGGGMMHPAAWLSSRGVVEQAGNWNEELSLNDDGEYFFRAVLASKGVKFCMGAKSYYRSGIPNSLSTRNSDAALESAFLAIKLCSSYLLASEDSVRTRHASATAFQRFIYSAYPDEPNLVQKSEIMVQELGGTDLQPSGGAIFQALADTIGWKPARQIQKLSYSIFL